MAKNNRTNPARVGSVKTAEGYATESRSIAKSANKAAASRRTFGATNDKNTPNPLRRKPSYPSNSESSKIKSQVVA